jgi:F-type H+-transporting ATPase subunit epsilon
VADERHTFSLSLTTPDGAVFDDEAEMVIVPGAAGEIGVLARHAPLIALLQAGSTRVYTNREAEEVQEFATGPGFFTVEQDRALALVDTAVNVREIDPAAAQELLEQAKAELERVERGESEADRWQLEQRIKAAENQLAASGRTCCRRWPPASIRAPSGSSRRRATSIGAAPRRRPSTSRSNTTSPSSSRFSSRPASTC